MIRVTRHGKLRHIETDIGSISIHDEVLRSGNPSFETRILCYLADYLEKQPAAAQEVVAYLDIGAGGYLDLGSNLPEVQLLALPKGRHALGIIGTYGIDGYVATHVAAAPAVNVAILRALADRWATDRSYTGSPVDDIRALIEQPSTSTHAALGIDLEPFREAVENLEWQNRGHANPDFPTGDPEKHAECLRLLALIDASPKGGSTDAQDTALNTLAVLFHNGEEVEGPDGMAVRVDLNLWHEASDAFDLLNGNFDAETLATSAEVGA